MYAGGGDYTVGKQQALGRPLVREGPGISAGPVLHLSAVGELVPVVKWNQAPELQRGAEVFERIEPDVGYAVAYHVGIQRDGAGGRDGGACHGDAAELDVGDIT